MQYIEPPMPSLTINGKNKICRIPGRIDGKVALVTGASIGCGLELTGELARRGAKVIMACRDKERGLQAREVLVKRYGMLSKDAWKYSPAGPAVQPYLTPIRYAQLVVEELDLASMQSIRKFAAKILREYKKIDFLISNAGVMATSYMETSDGFELQFGVNHLGPVLLVNLLMPALLSGSTPSRIMITTSNLYKQGEICWNGVNLKKSDYTPFKAYDQSKLANMLFVRELYRKYDGLKIIPMAVHPGGVRNEVTRLPNNTYQLFVRAVGITPWEGAQTALHCCLIDDPVPGGYYENCQLEYVNDKINDRDAKRLWDVTAPLVGISDGLPN